MFGFNKKTIIGRLESINIPTLDLKNIPTKIDTGAYRGSIHATNIREIEENGQKVLKFNLFDENHPEYQNKTYTFKDYKIHKFKGTVVDTHDRYVIPLQIEIAGKTLEIELSLSDRTSLRFPILLGRKHLKKNFLIDVDQKNI